MSLKDSPTKIDNCRKVSLQGGKKVKDGQKYTLELIAAKADQEIQVHVCLNSPQDGYSRNSTPVQLHGKVLSFLQCNGLGLR